MTPQEFAATIRAKYPQYKEIPDDKLVSSYLDKFPQYKDLVKEEPKTPLLLRQPNEGVEQHEPDTFWGGFGKSVLDQVMAGGKDNPIRRAANPQGVGDMASMLLPSAIGEHLPSIKEFGSRSVLAMKAAGQETSGVKGAATFPFRAASKFADSLPSANEAAISKFKGAPVTPTPSPPPVGQAPIQGNALAKKWLDELGVPSHGLDEASPVSTPAPVTAKPSDPIAGALDAAKAERNAPSVGVRMGGKAPTLEDELQKALEDIRKPSDPRITSMAPEQGITPGAPIKQSGKFGKADALGKPGGYSSGNPGTTPEQSGLKSVEAQGVHTDALAEQEHQRLLDKFGGRGEDVAAPGAEAPSAMPEPSSAPAPDSLPQTDVEKPHVGWKEALDNLQTRVGARDAARAVGGKQAGYTPEDIRGITGKRGQLPQEAQDRILEDMLRKAMERDQP